MTAPRRSIVDPREGGLDAITTLGALSSEGIALGVVVGILGGRSLPVSVRELTTLEHLAGGDLVVLLDPQGCTEAQVKEAVALIEAMAAHEVTSTSGPTWKLHEAPNRPLPTRGAFKLFLLSRDDREPLSDLEAATGISIVSSGQSGIVGEVWDFCSAEQVVAMVERSKGSIAP